MQRTGTFLKNEMQTRGPRHWVAGSARVGKHIFFAKHIAQLKKRYGGQPNPFKSPPPHKEVLCAFRRRGKCEVANSPASSDDMVFLFIFLPKKIIDNNLCHGKPNSRFRTFRGVFICTKNSDYSALICRIVLTILQNNAG